MSISRLSTANNWVARHAGPIKTHAASLHLLVCYSGASAGGWAGGVFWSHLGWNGLVGMLAVLLAGTLATTRGLPPRAATRVAEAQPEPAIEELAEVAEAGAATAP